MEELTEEVIKTFNERKIIPSKLLEKNFGIEVSKVLAKLVEMDLIVLDNLQPSIWKLK